MFIQVYFHKTRRYLDHLLVEALKEVLPEGRYPSTLEEYLALDDAEIYHKIRTARTANASKYRQREIMTCVRETSAHADKNEARLFRMICSAVKRELPEDAVFVDDADKSAHKLQPLYLALDDDSGKEIKIIDKHTKDVRNIMEDSLILGGIVKPISIHRLYVAKPYTEQAKGIMARISAY